MQCQNDGASVLPHLVLLFNMNMLILLKITRQKSFSIYIINNNSINHLHPYLKRDLKVLCNVNVCNEKHIQCFRTLNIENINMHTNTHTFLSHSRFKLSCWITYRQASCKTRYVQIVSLLMQNIIHLKCSE